MSGHRPRKRAKINPAAMAKASRPTSASTPTTALATAPTGATVPGAQRSQRVMLKKKARRTRSVNCRPPLPAARADKRCRQRPGLGGQVARQQDSQELRPPDNGQHAVVAGERSQPVHGRLSRCRMNQIAIQQAKARLVGYHRADPRSVLSCFIQVPLLLLRQLLRHLSNLPSGPRLCGNLWIG